MRKVRFAPGEYYHIYNRGNNKQNIFRDERDRWRFLFLILYLQSLISFIHVTRFVNYFVQHRVLDKSTMKPEEKHVEVVGFCLMPNHFHLIIHELKEGGISRYMQKVLNAYTKYFNTKYESSGHLFQGPFQAVHVRDNEQLLYLSAYIHRNPRELKGWKNKEYTFFWSSYQDYVGENRWGKELESDIILKQFSGRAEYKTFVEESGAKENDFGEELLLD